MRFAVTVLITLLPVLVVSVVAQGALGNLPADTPKVPQNWFDSQIFYEDEDHVADRPQEFLLTLPIDSQISLGPEGSIESAGLISEQRPVTYSQFEEMSYDNGSEVTPQSHRECDPAPCRTRIFGWLRYTDGSQERPIRSAYVELWDCDQPVCGGPTDDFVASTTTDPSGYFEVEFVNCTDQAGLSFHCGFADDDLGDIWCDCYVVPFSKNDAVADVFCPVVPCVTAQTHRWRFEKVQDMARDSLEHDYGTKVVPSGDDNEAFRIFDSILTAWLYIRDTVGFQVPRVGVEFPCPVVTCPGAPYFDVGHPVATNNVRMKSGFSRGAHVHEYGHFVMFKAYGDWWPVPFIDQLACLTHFIERACDDNIGWSEGWAHFLALAVFNNASELETPPSCVSYPDGSCSTFENGDRVEGRVAAALWDLFDQRDDGKDEYGVGFQTIFETLWNGNRHSLFREFYDDYRARHPADAPALNAAAFQNTINYNCGPQATSINSGVPLGGWGSGRLTIAVTASDDSCGYVDGYIRRVTYDYSIDNVNWNPIGTLNVPFPGRSPPYSLEWNTGTLEDSSVWVRALVQDNLEMDPPEIVFGPFGIENTPPVTVGIIRPPDSNSWYNHPVTITWSATDSLSGVASCDSPTSYSGPDRVSIVIRGRCVDNAGNTGVSVVTINYDSTSPETLVTSAVDGNGASIAQGGQTLFEPINFAFVGSDIVSGVAGFECSIDGSTFSACTSPLLVAIGAGTHTFHVRAVDVAGNIDPTAEIFTWTIITPGQASQTLIDTVEAMGLASGTERSLLGPLTGVLQILSDTNAENDPSVCDILKAFVTLVNRHEAGGQLTPAQAADLRHQATDIRTKLGCT